MMMIPIQKIVAQGRIADHETDIVQHEDGTFSFTENGITENGCGRLVDKRQVFKFMALEVENPPLENPCRRCYFEKDPFCLPGIDCLVFDGDTDVLHIEEVQQP